MGQSPKPILIKISPDLTNAELDDVLSVVETRGIQGVIATNTTVGREGLSESTSEAGGLSGPPLFLKALEKVQYIHARLPNLPIVASGGIRDSLTAWKMLMAGARLCQIYTGLVYHGPGIIPEINRGILGQLATMNKTIAAI